MTDKVARLVKQLDFKVRTSNGCRIFGPANGCDRVPEEDSEVFVGRLTPNMMEDSIYTFFRTAGEIYSIKMFFTVHHKTKKYCFVRYFTRAAALRAVLTLNLKPFPGIPSGLYVAQSSDHRTLLVTGASVSLTKIVQEIKGVIYGVGKVICTQDLVAPFRMTMEFQDHGIAKKVLKRFSPYSENWGPGTTLEWQPNDIVDLREMLKQIKQQQKDSASTGELDSEMASSSSDSGRSSNESQGNGEFHAACSSNAQQYFPQGSQQGNGEFHAACSSNAQQYFPQGSQQGNGEFHAACSSNAQQYFPLYAILVKNESSTAVKEPEKVAWNLTDAWKSPKENDEPSIVVESPQQISWDLTDAWDSPKRNAVELPTDLQGAYYLLEDNRNYLEMCKAMEQATLQGAENLPEVKDNYEMFNEAQQGSYQKRAQNLSKEKDSIDYYEMFKEAQQGSDQKRAQRLSEEKDDCDYFNIPESKEVAKEVRYLFNMYTQKTGNQDTQFKMLQ